MNNILKLQVIDSLLNDPETWVEVGSAVESDLFEVNLSNDDLTVKIVTIHHVLALGGRDYVRKMRSLIERSKGIVEKHAEPDEQYKIADYDQAIALLPTC